MDNDHRFDHSILADIVRSVMNAPPIQDPPSLALFAAARGSNSTGELMVVGRATNGWGGQRFRAGRIEGDVAVDAIVQAAMAGTSWIDSGPIAAAGESAFWRVSRDVSGTVLGPLPAGTQWSGRLMWSNLYKVAPAISGSPCAELLRIQLPDCKRLLFEEFDQWRPRRVLFLTGWDWAREFLNDLETSARISPPPGVEEIRCLPHGALAVVVPHPRSKKEAPIVAGAVQAFASHPA